MLSTRKCRLTRCWKVSPCIELENVILYSAEEKPRTILEDITTLNAEKVLPRTMLEDVNLALNVAGSVMRIVQVRP